jgi:acyl carrier protein
VSANRDVAAAVIAKVLPGVGEQSYGTEFEWIEVDSFDLVTLRVSLEEQLGPVSDDSWTSFRTVNDVLSHFASMTGSSRD